ncbi:MAG: ABC transporter permease [Prevotella sp.]|nr:ABC transporter permease [Prevotella sp.]
MGKRNNENTDEGSQSFLSIWTNQMRAIFKDEGILIFAFLVPLLYPLLYSWIYTNEVAHEVPVAVVDMSHSNLSREFIDKFDASPNTRVAYYCDNLNEAKDLIGQQKVFGVLYFPEDFQSSVYRMQQGHVQIFCDMSFMLYYKAVYETATEVSQVINTNIMIERSGNWTAREDEISTKPLDFDEVQIFNPTGGYGTFILPGVLMLIIQQTLLLSIGLLAGSKREKARYSTPSNNNKSHQLSPSSNNVALPLRGELEGAFLRELKGTVATALSFFLIYAVMAAYNTLLVPKLFRFTSLLHAPDMLLFMLPYLLACIFFAMTVSFAVKYRENVMLIVVFSSIVFLFISGVSWPQSSIPKFWQWISSLIPSTFGIRGFIRMNTMGARLSDIMPEYIALWLQTIFYFILTLCLTKYSKKKVKD